MPLVVLAPAVFFSPFLFARYFQAFEAPALKKTGEVSECSSHLSVIPEKTPRDCDFVITERAAEGRIRETFYFADSSRFSIETLNGRWKSFSATCTNVERQGSLSLIGMFLMFIVVLGKSFRTRQFFYFPGMERHPLSEFELILGIYAVCFFAGGAFGMGSGCSAMAVPM